MVRVLASVTASLFEARRDVTAPYSMGTGNVCLGPPHPFRSTVYSLGGSGSFQFGSGVGSAKGHLEFLLATSFGHFISVPWDSTGSQSDVAFYPHVSCVLL